MSKTYYLGQTKAGAIVGRGSASDYGYTHAAVTGTYAQGQVVRPSDGKFSTSAAGAARNAGRMAHEVVTVSKVDRREFEAAMGKVKADNETVGYADRHEAWKAASKQLGTSMGLRLVTGGPDSLTDTMVLTQAESGRWFWAVAPGVAQNGVLTWATDKAAAFAARAACTKAGVKAPLAGVHFSVQPNGEGYTYLLTDVAETGEQTPARTLAAAAAAAPKLAKRAPKAKAPKADAPPAAADAQPYPKVDGIEFRPVRGHEKPEGKRTVARFSARWVSTGGHSQSGSWTTDQAKAVEQAKAKIAQGLRAWGVSGFFAP